MIIDCDQCMMQGTDACDDCVVSCLLGEGPVELSESEESAVSNLADTGLVPRLRLVPVQRRVS